MSEYQLEIKQIVDYPRCRIYRQFIGMLLKENQIRIGHTAGLFHYTLLCCYANFRTSYKRVDGISYTINPGEWICTAKELSEWFRLRFQYQAIDILKDLQDKHLLTFSVLGRGKLIKYKIKGWRFHNRVLDYNAPCQKDTGFFFLPISTANEIIGNTRCSEMDALLDLWINTVYNDANVQGSETGPVVYIRNGSGNPLIGCAELGMRWGISKATANRYLKKLQELNFVDIHSFPGTHGSAIYLRRYLSTMFEISDVLVDKEELAMALNIKIDLPENASDERELSQDITVSKYLSGVSKSYIPIILSKVSKILSAQGFPCCSCPQIQYKLLPLSIDCRDVYLVPHITKTGKELRFMLVMSCNESKEVFRFDVRLVGGAENEK